MGSKNTYLTQSEMENNAQIIYGIFNSLGYNFSSICAILGNMQQESTLSPIFAERGGGGYGLLQWTPKSDLTDACSKLGLSPYKTAPCNVIVLMESYLSWEVNGILRRHLLTIISDQVHQMIWLDLPRSSLRQMQK